MRRFLAIFRPAWESASGEPRPSPPMRLKPLWNFSAIFRPAFKAHGITVARSCLCHQRSDGYEKLNQLAGRAGVDRAGLRLLERPKEPGERGWLLCFTER